MISTSIMDIGFEYDAAGDIRALNDNLNFDRSQRFEYNAVSRLTRAEGVYGDIDYSYNLVGDRESRIRQRPASDGGLQTVTEDYSYDPDTFRLTSVSVGATMERAFGYTSSGQITRDDRTGQGQSDFTFENNARGRLVRVLENGVLKASYLYDDDEQRIVKTSAGGTVHYHYDLEGRLIAETDGETGAVIRDYLWLGLAPVAVIAAGEGGGLPEGCDPDETARIEALRDLRQATLDMITAQVALLETTRETRLATLATVTARRDTLQGRLDAANPANTDRIADLTARIARDDGRIAELTANIDSLDERLAYYAERTDYLSGRVSALTVRADRLAQACDEPANDNTASAMLYYLHTDHLGRPKVATDTDGAVVWDGGLTTPFGRMRPARQVGLYAVYLYELMPDLIDALIDALIKAVNKFERRAENSVKGVVSKNIETVYDRERLLASIAAGWLAHKESDVEMSVDQFMQQFMDVSEAQVLAAKSGKSSWAEDMFERMRASWTFHYRGMLKEVLEILEFHTSFSAFEPLLRGLDWVHLKWDRRGRIDPIRAGVPIEGVIPPKYIGGVIKPDGYLDRHAYQKASIGKFLLRVLRGAEL